MPGVAEFAWTVNDFDAARSDAGTLATVTFDSGDGVKRTYANVRVHRSGSERKGQMANAFGKMKSKDWPKTNFRFKFSKKGAGGAAAGGDQQLFVWRTGFPPVKTINLHSMYQVRIGRARLTQRRRGGSKTALQKTQRCIPSAADPGRTTQESGPLSYMRKHLAHRFMEEAGESPRCRRSRFVAILGVIVRRAADGRGWSGLAPPATPPAPPRRRPGSVDSVRAHDGQWAVLWPLPDDGAGVAGAGMDRAAAPAGRM